MSITNRAEYIVYTQFREFHFNLKINDCLDVNERKSESRIGSVRMGEKQQKQFKLYCSLAGMLLCFIHNKDQYVALWSVGNRCLCSVFNELMQIISHSVRGYFYALLEKYAMQLHQFLIFSSLMFFLNANTIAMLITLKFRGKVKNEPLSQSGDIFVFTFGHVVK